MNNRHASQTDEIVAAIHRITRHSWHIMEICGGQTHAIARYGIEDLLPAEITLIHGPGCPVCVTPESTERYFYFVRRYVACPGKKRRLVVAKKPGSRRAYAL